MHSVVICGANLRTAKYQIVIIYENGLKLLTKAENIGKIQ